MKIRVFEPVLMKQDYLAQNPNLPHEYFAKNTESTKLKCDTKSKTVSLTIIAFCTAKPSKNLSDGWIIPITETCT